MSKNPIRPFRFMREHHWTSRHLSAYLDGELEDAERGRVESHAQICPRCHRMLETLKKTLEGLRGLSAASRPPSGLADSVIERLREET